MRNGVARGVFSNESGLGSAPIVAAAAKTKWPAEQGLISMTGTFIDTIIICTLTGLVLVVSGAWMGDVNGAALTNAAFNMAFPAYGSIILCVGLTLFAFTTILGWNYYGVSNTSSASKASCRTALSSSPSSPAVLSSSSMSSGSWLIS